jgi:hypothetical protein
MVRVHAAAKSKLIALDLYLAHLFILAFCGRVESVGALLAHQLRSLAPEAKDYWTAIALKAGEGNDAAWRGLLTKLAVPARDTTTRRAAKRHLATPPYQARALLKPDSLATVDDAENWLRRQPQRGKMTWRRTPVTATLIALNVAGFAIEWIRGGPDQVETVIELGALWPPLVLQDGEWWRRFCITVCCISARTCCCFFCSVESASRHWGRSARWSSTVLGGLRRRLACSG